MLNAIFSLYLRCVFCYKKKTIWVITLFLKPCVCVCVSEKSTMWPSHSPTLGWKPTTWTAPTMLLWSLMATTTRPLPLVSHKNHTNVLSVAKSFLWWCHKIVFVYMEEVSLSPAFPNTPKLLHNIFQAATVAQNYLTRQHPSVMPWWSTSSRTVLYPAKASGPPTQHPPLVSSRCRTTVQGCAPVPVQTFDFSLQAVEEILWWRAAPSTVPATQTLICPIWSVSGPLGAHRGTACSSRSCKWLHPGYCRG